MATYILCGKDKEGRNAIQRGEITLGNTRYDSFRRTDDKNVSLEALLESPTTDETTLHSFNEKKNYIHGKPGIKRPRYSRKTGELLDPGDSEIPGMKELWESIDEMERWIHVLEGKLPPREDDLLFDDSYRLYRLKHQLIDLRRHQYYLKDAYLQPLFLPNADHPKPQYIDWTSDSYYWMRLPEWEKKVAAARVHTVSKDLKDYETREGEDGIEVKWIVRRHTFDWENYLHVRALIQNYDLLENLLANKINTYGKTLLLDFERYREMAQLNEIRSFLLDQRLQHIPQQQIAENLMRQFGVKYNDNHLGQILIKEIPQKIATAALRHHLLVDTPQEERKQCFRCKQFFPRHTLFFARNKGRKDGFSSNCKECERLRREKKKEQRENNGSVES